MHCDVLNWTVMYWILEFKEETGTADAILRLTCSQTILGFAGFHFTFFYRLELNFFNFSDAFQDDSCEVLYIINLKFLSIFMQKMYRHHWNSASYEPKKWFCFGCILLSSSSICLVIEPFHALTMKRILAISLPLSEIRQLFISTWHFMLRELQQPRSYAKLG